MGDQESFEKLRQELRRGALVLAVLAQMQREHYGYSLRLALLEKGLDIDEGTLYPLIRRLETQQLLESEWREENNRKKRFYKRTTSGDVVFKRLLVEWEQMNTNISTILQGELK